MGALCCCFGYNRHEPENINIRGKTSPDQLAINTRIKASSSSSSSQRVHSSTPDPNTLEVSQYQRISSSNKSRASSKSSSTKPSCAKRIANGFNLQTCSIISEDEECCPTCLEEYTTVNPKIIAKCCHHYHLSCIYSWQERSPNCPICDRVLLFEEMS